MPKRQTIMLVKVGSNKFFLTITTLFNSGKVIKLLSMAQTLFCTKFYAMSWYPFLRSFLDFNLPSIFMRYLLVFKIFVTTESLKPYLFSQWSFVWGFLWSFFWTSCQQLRLLDENNNKKSHQWCCSLAVCCRSPLWDGHSYFCVCSVAIQLLQHRFYKVVIRFASINLCLFSL